MRRIILRSPDKRICQFTTNTDLPIVVEPAKEQNKRDLPIMAEGRLQKNMTLYGALKIIIYLNNLSDVHTTGLHIPTPTADGKAPEWELSEYKKGPKTLHIL